MSIPTTPRTVIGLKVENFKRVEAVDISLDPTNPIVAISGANAQGKTSVLDALWSALSSSAATRATGTTKPVREGSKSASVTVDLGDIIVTRKWAAGGTSKLEVTSAETGAKFSSPQALLDGLLGKLSFDPLAFTRMSAKDQTTTLLDMVDLGIDLEAMAEERKGLYEARTQVGRDIKALGDVEAPADDIPTVEVSAGDVLAEISAANEQNQKRREAHTAVQACEGRLAELEFQLVKLQRQIVDENSQLVKLQAQVDGLPPVVDMGELEAKLTGVEGTNRMIREANQQREKLAKLADLEATRESYSQGITDLDSTKSKALAEAAFPLEGLSFDDSGVTYLGQPFGQASAAEQLRVSCALAAALNPSIRVMRVTDGSLLDAQSREALAGIAAEEGFQIWMELVDESGEIGIVIEDGKVKTNDH